MKTKIRNAIAGIPMGAGREWHDDNLAIAICSYFEDHSERPGDDRDDDECWSPWVRERYEETMDRIVEALLKVHPLQKANSDNG